jgi:hypothetical protein
LYVIGWSSAQRGPVHQNEREQVPHFAVPRKWFFGDDVVNNSLHATPRSN